MWKIGSQNIKSSCSLLQVVTFHLWLCFTLGVNAQNLQAGAAKVVLGKPALIATTDLSEFDTLPDDRKKLIGVAVAVARDSPWLPYTARGSSPSDGGFDCSGAMYFVLRKAGLDPARTSSGQFEWLKENDRLYEVPPDVVNLNHPSLKNLHPGDLLFWGKRRPMKAGMKEEITHVAMFLGLEKKDDHPVMINSTDGRSYRGIKANGYGIYDFRLPSAGARISFMGYGTPPGLLKMPKE
jgi:cell wall-associated NlpC family hydrolase